MIDLGHKNIIDVVKYRWVWLTISILMIVPGIIGMAYSTKTYDTHTPLRVGIDFTGGTITQYATAQNVETSKIEQIRKNLDEAGISNPQIQIINANSNEIASDVEKADIAEEKAEGKDVKNIEENSTISNIISVRSKFIDEENSETFSKMTTAIQKTVPDATIEQVNSVGPTLGAELFKNSMLTLLLAFVIVIAYLAWRFQLDYAIIAILALFHDILFICGIFSIFGLVFGTEIDSLFVTAIMTIVGYSINDTIVTFDRIRENIRFFGKKATISEIVNASVNQTIRRSLNTSVTTLLTLLALYFFGGVTTKDFVLALILGIVSGTYSSIFFASTILEWHKSKNQGKSVARR